ncbi:MAG: hypothetical protein R3A79_08990 [Nannocystaceae bacterium]
MAALFAAPTALAAPAPAEPAEPADEPEAIVPADAEADEDPAEATPPAIAPPTQPDPDPDPAPEGPADEAVDAEPEPAPAPEPAPEGAAGPAIEPPRVDGPYVGVTPFVPMTFARVRNLDADGVFVGPGGSARAGEAVFPWMTIGVELTGSLGYKPAQRVGQGALLIDVGFLPMPKRPLSLHVGFGVGGGAVREDGVEGRSGFGGAAFKAAARYEFFPLAKRLRPRRGGGFGLGPELGWIGFTPAAAGRPMSNTLYLGLATTYYFGS